MTLVLGRVGAGDGGSGLTVEPTSAGEALTNRNDNAGAHPSGVPGVTPVQRTQV